MPANAQLAAMFNDMAAVTQLNGENVFKAVAFQKVARILGDLNFDVAEKARTGELEPIEGIGASSLRVIEQYANHGKSEDYENLVSSVPPGLLDMLKIPGLGPKTIALLWKERKIESVQELELAIRDGKLEGIKGLGEKKLASMSDGIRLLKAGLARRGMMEVAGIVNALLEYLRGDQRVEQVDVAGSYRRRRETVGDADLICCVKKFADAAAIVGKFTSFPGCEKVLASGGTKGSMLVHGGFQVDLRVVPRESFGAALQYFTGSKEHNVHLRGLAQEKGLTLNEWGLYRLAEVEAAAKKTGEAPAIASIAGQTELSIYKALGLPYVEPELREDRGEIEAARAGKLPHVITAADIKGDLHCHTRASDGHNTIEEMAHAAKERGYQYLAITDHSPSSVIANGLSPERLKAHIAAIRKAQASCKGITLLAGSEVDIHPDGSLDYEPALLAELDLVIASPHASLKQDEKKAMDRMLRAIDTKFVNIIGHPTGRMINQREGLPLDMAKLIARAAASGTALEVNAGWPRWDLNDQQARAALQHGALLSINTDAHATQSFSDMEMGLWIARRAWAEPRHIINCFPLADLKKFLAHKR
jgi:DNA polymerase (family 10)